MEKLNFDHFLYQELKEVFRLAEIGRNVIEYVENYSTFEHLFLKDASSVFDVLGEIKSGEIVMKDGKLKKSGDLDEKE